jgi:hypothetical protein
LLEKEMFNLACRRQVKKIEIMSLENLNLAELNAQELQEVDGGNPYVGWIISAAAGSFLYGIVEDWNGNVAAFNSAYQKGRT